MTKILIVGDSFASTELSGQKGWPILMSNRFSVTNIAKPGVGQFKILCQLNSQSLDLYDFVIVSHTSPYRVHVTTHPCYPDGHLYAKSDLILADIESKKEPIAESFLNYFKFAFDPVYYEFVHKKCCQEIEHLADASNSKFIHMTHFNWKNLHQFPQLLDFHHLWLSNKGDFVHYNQHGNEVIFNKLIERIYQ